MQNSPTVPTDEQRLLNSISGEFLTGSGFEAEEHFRQEVTDSIVKMLEEGVTPWQKLWEPSTGAFGMPTNPTTEKS